MTKKIDKIVIPFSSEIEHYKKTCYELGQEGGTLWKGRFSHDIRKFKQLELIWKEEGTGRIRIGFVDALGKSTLVDLSKYSPKQESGWQKAIIPFGDFNLKELDPRTADNIVLICADAGKGTVCLKEIVLYVKKFTIINYTDVLLSGPFGRYFFNSILISLFITFGNILFCSMVAYSFARKEFPGKKTMFFLIISSIMIPPQLLMVPMFILMKNIHWLNTYWALIIPALTEPFNIFLLRQYISGLPKDLEDAAIIDGATDWQVLLKVIMPLSKPALAIVGINTFMGSWNSFLYPFLLTNTTEMRTLPVGLALYKSLYAVDWTHLMAASSITAIPVIIVFLCFQRHIIAGLTSGAVKG